MIEKNIPQRSLLVKAAAFVLVVGGVRVAAGFLTPILLGLFFTILFAPLHHYLIKKRIPSALALIIIVLLVVAGGAALSLIISRTAVQFTHNMPAYGTKLQAMVERFGGQLKSLGLDITKESMESAVPTKAIVGFASKFLASLGAMISQMALVLLIAIFLLLEIRSLPERLKRAFPESPNLHERYDDIAKKVRHYIGIKTLVSFCTGALVAIWSAIFGLDFPLFGVFLAFLMNFIPNIGSFLAAIPAVLLALITLGLSGGMLIGAGYLTINMVVGNIIEPRVMGRGVGLSPAVVFLSLLFWGWVLGPVGMFLSVPLTAMVKIVLESQASTRSVATLLGEPPAPAKPKKKTKAPHCKSTPG